MILHRRNANAVAVVAFAAAAAIAAHHALSIREYGWTDLRLICAAAFAWLTFTSIVTYLHRDVPLPEPGSHAAALLDRLHVTVVVPAHNEDPAMFLAMLESLRGQTRRPDRIHIVENGGAGYQPALRPVLRAWLARRHPDDDTEVRYDFNPVGDKRHAQAVAVTAAPDTDVIVTIDSDVKLADTAIAAGLAPFRSAKVACVTGMLVGLNVDMNLLTRLIEPSFVCAYLNGRAAHSMLRSVTVNSGAISFYRAAIWHKYLDHYLTHKVAGRTMKSGDDAMMTRYSLLEGQALFQAGCWGYTPHPESIARLTSQRLRWWRSHFWEDMWLLRTFRPTRFVWWSAMWGFVSMAWMTVALPFVVIVRPALNGVAPWMVLAWAIGITYISRARYLTIIRPGEPFRAHLRLWLLAPASALLDFYLGFILSYAGLLTCLKDGWSSRDTVQITYPTADAALPAPPPPAIDERTMLLPVYRRPDGTPVRTQPTALPPTVRNDWTPVTAAAGPDRWPRHDGSPRPVHSSSGQRRWT